MYAHTQMHTCIHIHTHSGVWTHLTWSLSRSTPTASSGVHNIYVNGVLKASAIMKFPMVQTNTNYIAKSSHNNDLYVGDMDSFAIYPWVLRASDAQFVFESTGILVCVGVCVYICVLLCVLGALDAEFGIVAI